MSSTLYTSCSKNKMSANRVYFSHYAYYLVMFLNYRMWMIYNVRITIILLRYVKCKNYNYLFEQNMSFIVLVGLASLKSSNYQA